MKNIAQCALSALLHLGAAGQTGATSPDAARSGRAARSKRGAVPLPNHRLPASRPHRIERLERRRLFTAEPLAAGLSLTPISSPDIIASEVGAPIADAIVARFRDADAAANASCAAIIEWGDGTATTARLAPDGAQQVFDVIGSHAYNEPAEYQVLVIISNASGAAIQMRSKAIVFEVTSEHQARLGSEAMDAVELHQNADQATPDGPPRDDDLGMETDGGAHDVPSPQTHLDPQLIQAPHAPTNVLFSERIGSRKRDNTTVGKGDDAKSEVNRITPFHAISSAARADLHQAQDKSVESADDNWRTTGTDSMKSRRQSEVMGIETGLVPQHAMWARTGNKRAAAGNGPRAVEFATSNAGFINRPAERTEINQPVGPLARARLRAIDAWWEQLASEYCNYESAIAGPSDGSDDDLAKNYLANRAPIGLLYGQAAAGAPNVVGVLP